MHTPVAENVYTCCFAENEYTCCFAENEYTNVYYCCFVPVNVLVLQKMFLLVNVLTS